MHEKYFHTVWIYYDDGVVTDVGVGVGEFAGGVDLEEAAEFGHVHAGAVVVEVEIGFAFLAGVAVGFGFIALVIRPDDAVGIRKRTFQHKGRIV